MGLGPLNNWGHPFWGALTTAANAVYDTAHHAAFKLVPYAPLITPCVATVAGVIALYSIHVTRSIARKRATIDFFLKTEADGSIVKLFQQFDGHLIVVKKHLDDGKPFTEILITEEYKTVHACLNMHELIAVGIANKVFDEKVAYNYWSGALVGHCKDAAKLIDASRADPDDMSAYIAMLELNAVWKKKLDRWTIRQPARPPQQQPVVILRGPIVPHFGDPEM